jgi:glutamate N-acetyltransferase/amino-acid N-acetyltransferase
VAASAAYAAEALGCSTDEVFLASTGVIGEPLDPNKFAGVTRDMSSRLVSGPWMEPARAIMTTDTFPKLAAATVEFDGVPVSISGIAKGSGMIAPDMATMLSFIFTDAPIDARVLQGLLQPQIDKSFNSITVDSDTSTSDTCLVFATGKAAIAPIMEAGDPRAAVFAEALGDVLHDLAMLTVRDGEGATKMVTVTVEGAESDRSAFRIAQSIANSPLVKTAIAGEDANWGRVVMAVGKAGEPADRDKLSIAFGDITVAENGERVAGYDEAAASAYMKNQELEIRVGLGLGTGAATVYTCDLTHGYITINGDYRS